MIFEMMTTTTTTSKRRHLLYELAFDYVNVEPDRLGREEYR